MEETNGHRQNELDHHMHGFGDDAVQQGGDSLSFELSDLDWTMENFFQSQASSYAPSTAIPSLGDARSTKGTAQDRPLSPHIGDPKSPGMDLSDGDTGLGIWFDEPETVHGNGSSPPPLTVPIVGSYIS
jgi:hypothetical protein